MSKINYDDYDYNFRESLMNRIKVNKRENINSKTIKNYNKIKNNSNSKDNLYYSIEKRTKPQKNKIPPSLNKNYKKKGYEQEFNNIKKNSNRDNFKKTISIYSNENQEKDGNIFEILQSNKYLLPMLGTSNINNKLLKCQLPDSLKNIYTLSLKNYITNNVDFPFQKFQSPKRKNYNNNDISTEDRINIYNLNNRTAMERFNIYLNNGFSPSNEILYIGDNISNSFGYSGDSFALNNYLTKLSPNNNKKYSMNQFGRMKKEKYFYSEERKEKDDSNSNQGSIKVYCKNSIGVGSPSSNSVRNKTLNNYVGTKINLQKKNKKNLKSSKDIELLQIYKSKLVDEFIIVLKKFFTKHLNKIKNFFFQKIMKYNKSNSHSKSKIYFKKKNHRFNKKKLTLKSQKTIDDRSLKYSVNIDKEKEKEKNKGKVTTDTSTNFNLGNKSFSNEIKNSSLSNNFILNNIKINNQSSSFLFSEQKHKNYSQSPDDSINNKIPKTQIRTKTIIYKKQLSGSPNKVITKSPSHNETRESLGAYACDTFVYRKKNLNSENISINKLNNLDLKSFYSQSKKYNKIINHNKKGKIIDIDINLGKPVNIINDHSPLEELYLETNNPMLFKLNTISSKFMNKNKRNKARSGSKNKIKPPLRIKRFAEEDDEEFFNNYNLDSNSVHSSIKKYKEKENNLMNINKYLYNNLDELIFSNKINREYYKNKEENRETIIKGDKLYIRINYFSFFGNLYDKDDFKNLNIGKKISISIGNELNKNKHTRKVSKLYINCTKFLVKILNKVIKKKIFIMINKKKKYKKI